MKHLSRCILIVAISSLIVTPIANSSPDPTLPEDSIAELPVANSCSKLQLLKNDSERFSAGQGGCIAGPGGCFDVMSAGGN